MTADKITALAQTDPTQNIVERGGESVQDARKAVATLETKLRELETVTGQLAERQLVVATDLGATGNAARSAYQADRADAGKRTYELPKVAA